MNVAEMTPLVSIAGVARILGEPGKIVHEWQIFPSQKLGNPFLFAKTSDGKKVSQVTTARIALCNFIIANFFTRRLAYGSRPQAFATTTSPKVTARQSSDWAGATPLFCGQSAQKFLGVTPAHTHARKESTLHTSAI